jgi:hypothetical protein
MATEGNDSAFAAMGTAPDGLEIVYGLTKREYFALMIYSASLANPQPYSDSPDDAVKRADQLIEALNSHK